MAYIADCLSDDLRFDRVPFGSIRSCLLSVRHRSVETKADLAEVASGHRRIWLRVAVQLTNKENCSLNLPPLLQAFACLWKQQQMPWRLVHILAFVYSVYFQALFDFFICIDSAAESSQQ